MVSLHCGNGGLEFDRSPTDIFQKIHHDALEVLNKIQPNCKCISLRTHSIMFFRLETTSNHKNPNFKNYLKIHQFIGEGIKSSSWAKLKLFAGRIWPAVCRLLMRGLDPFPLHQKEKGILFL